MATITWSIENLVTETIANEENYIVHAAYRVDAVDGEYTGYYCGSVNFSTTNVDNFIPYSELTELEVIQWVMDALGQSECTTIEDCCLAQIEVAKQPITPNNRPQKPW